MGTGGHAAGVEDQGRFIGADRGAVQSPVADNRRAATDGSSEQDVNTALDGYVAQFGCLNRSGDGQGGAVGHTVEGSGDEHTVSAGIGHGHRINRVGLVRRPGLGRGGRLARSDACR